ncbi:MULTISPECIES: class I SAM-dependent methyltransferase [unclassified Bradyrhizobium]|uniref:class I SAM-dependent methyltransferase n=1 Tax=unclassified Bradyrhizobium TaxID=2631580 RepID=UPI001FF96A5A|nr:MULTISPECIES: class I SAM-dependent methyltransferase [unclassified Bradyrhizobium]MCK1271792.1 class I SAM-dependent methyltransferase [Bradyrhizobium sp. 84]MCK1369834.1 class I SAM-dependent methyltransferase [Bradyrhizobium sp. 49]MCK1614356.1 class I SAM-dependent methyltransferase [Bradyrhizobium sp. 163]MCK1765644.1 class I SAM-dependent methyltransferase [Bradyrhizobium sp. 136]
MSCLTCGTAFHASSTAEDDIRAIYEDDYELATAAPKSDAARARAYGDWIRTEFNPPNAVLEIGCGSGALLSDLLRTWPDARACGVDPALPATAQSQQRLRLVRGFVEDVPADAGPFDLIVAVNVIEHTTNPGAFLRSLRDHLAPNGRLVIICPDGHSPNVELMFFDHLYSLTRGGLRICGRGAALAAERQMPAPSNIGDFQMSIFAAQTDDRDTPPVRDTDPTRLHSERQTYLEHWRMLDQFLLDQSRSATALSTFGAGQTAALLRAYAPEIWARIDSLLLDDPAEAWNLGRPVASYRDAVQNPGRSTLIATTPHVQQAIAGRLERDGLHPITWNELIPR